ncbi:MAG: type II toxin-antitoxin system RelE/ParE family toxin [Oscillospiraceae bacterium]|nr:type II toxin-antitoxin system RelE/ParE family toxin [Oscillospiraceae bacterium]
MAEQYKVKLVSRALRDLEDIYHYIAGTLSEPGTALDLVDEIECGILSLEQFPNRCAMRRTGVYANKGYRQLFVKNYTIVFRVEETEKIVVVVAVRYSASHF